MLKRARICVGLLIGFGFLLVFVLALRVQAQAGEQEWSAPVNVSESGSATDPQAVVSADGVLHLLWLDAFNGFIYAQGRGEGLTEPVQADYPFGREVFLLQGGNIRIAYTPLLVADPANRVHAFWADDEDGLFYSRVLAEEFSTLASWTAQQQLAEAALAYDVDVAADGILHLSYVRPVSAGEFPAGVYYRNSGDGGATWSNPVLLYQSPYFRSLSRQEAQVEVEATGEGQVIVAWDNRPEERVFIIRSGDSGETWEEAAEIDRRRNDDIDTAVGPSKISVVEDGEIIHLLWQAGHESLLCAQYHQWSADGGVTWQAPRRVLSEFEGCSQENAYVVVPGGLVMVSAFESGVYTQFWNGSQWSQPERHGILTGFSNPSTFRSVDLGCRDFVVQNDRVFVFGCDSSGNNDIWQISTGVNNLTQNESESSSVWSGQELVVAQADGERLSSPVLVADADGRVHAFWSQQTGVGSTINYMVSEGAGWSTPVDVLASPGTNSQAENPAAVYHPDGQLMMVWDNGVQGEVFFSHVATGLAGSAAEWFEPEQLPALETTAGSADIAIAPDGIIYVVYALRLNEDRGIYLVSSDDEGESWSDPSRVFDGVEAEWEAVDDPRIEITGDGFLHVMWTQRSFPPENAALSTAYAASTDNGESWSEMTDLAFADVPAVWSDFKAAETQTLFRVWQEDVDGFSNYWSQVSNDSGLNWEPPVRISDRNHPVGEADLALDGGGRPHLVQLTGFAGAIQEDEGALSSLYHWSWSEGGWVAEESFATQPGSLVNVDGIAAAVAANGELAVLYSGLSLNVETGRLEPGYLASSRSLSLVVSTPTPAAAITTTVTVTGTTEEPATSTPQPTIAPTPTVFFPQEPESGGGFSLPFLGSLGGIAAVIPIGFVVLLIVLVSVRVVRSGRS